MEHANDEYAYADGIDGKKGTKHVPLVRGIGVADKMKDRKD